MGGSLEGVCAAGLADAIVDLRQTGSSLIRHGLRALAVIERCEAQLVYTDDAGPAVLDAVDRLRAVLAARACRYVMLHAPREALAAVSALLGGLEGPTVLPLAGRDDLVALHTVMTPERLWELREPLTELGCRGIVALNPDAVIQ
jgi:ATP phosphoribosyltransferase